MGVHLLRVRLHNRVPRAGTNLASIVRTAPETGERRRTDVGCRGFGEKTKAGIGDTKREEVRFLFLSGLPHAEVVKRSDVSSGTVSLIRKEIRDVVPIYRSSESGIARRLRAAATKFAARKRAKPLKKLVVDAGSR